MSPYSVSGERSPGRGSAGGACAGGHAQIALVGWLGEGRAQEGNHGVGDLTLMAMVGAALGPNYACSRVIGGRGAVTFVCWYIRSDAALAAREEEFEHRRSSVSSLRPPRC